MAVPDHIRKVPRPVNTIVEDNGREGPNRFAVRERISTRYVPGGNPQPRNGKVIGHIRDGKYVPKQEPVASSVPDMLSYGASAFVRSVTGDILDDLLAVYAIKDAYMRTLQKSYLKALRLQKCHDLVECFAAFQVSVHDRIRLDPALLLLQVLQFLGQPVVAVL